MKVWERYRQRLTATEVKRPEKGKNKDTAT